MNRTAVACGATSTSLVSPHGMGHDDNLSSARDVLRVSLAALRHPVISEVVSTPAHVGSAVGTRFGRTVVLKKFKWGNTNALLTGFPGSYDGIKTGWVPNAHGQHIHACLASRVTAPPTLAPPARQLYCVVIGSTTKPGRFIDTHQLVTWAWGLPLHALLPPAGGNTAVAAADGEAERGAPLRSSGTAGEGAKQPGDGRCSRGPAAAGSVDPASIGVRVTVTGTPRPGD